MECYYSCQHGSCSTQEQCPYCNARNESAEIVRLRAENEALRTLANKMVGVLGIDLPESDSTEMLLTHACNRVQEIQYLIRQLALAAGGG